MSLHDDRPLTREGVPYALGEQVANLEALHSAALSRKSVIVPSSSAWNKAISAAFMLNQQGVVILRAIRTGMFIYLKQPKQKTNES